MTKPSEWAMEKATAITGACSCHAAYVGRRLIDPGCAWHGYAEDIAAALDQARAEALAENVKLREALEWYASGGEGERFQIVDSKGEVIANYSEFTSRARAALTPQGGGNG